MARYQLIFAVSSMAFVTSCGGDGGGAVAAAQPTVVMPPTSTTPPPPPPTSTRAAATDPIIGAAETSQTFLSDGRFGEESGVQVSFDMTTGNYSFSNPASNPPSNGSRLLYRECDPPAGQPCLNFVTGDGVDFIIRASMGATVPEFRYYYSNLAVWSSMLPPIGGRFAFGIPTPAGNGPSASSVTYSGLIEGTSTETYLSGGGPFKGNFQGTVTLFFDPAKGTAQLTITPALGLAKDYVLSPFVKTLTWSTGSATFYQPVAANPQSKDYPVTGRFTGPAAQELIGGVSVDYVSPIDGKAQTIKAAFIAKQ